MPTPHTLPLAGRPTPHKLDPGAGALGAGLPPAGSEAASACLLPLTSWGGGLESEKSASSDPSQTRGCCQELLPGEWPSFSQAPGDGGTPGDQLVPKAVALCLLLPAKSHMQPVVAATLSFLPLPHRGQGETPATLCLPSTCGFPGRETMGPAPASSIRSTDRAQASSPGIRLVGPRRRRRPPGQDRPEAAQECQAGPTFPPNSGPWGCLPPRCPGPTQKA